MGKILEVLARKALQGVDVRVMYDGTCEFSTLPRNYPRLLEKLNIQCKVFSRCSHSSLPITITATTGKFLSLTGGSVLPAV